MKLLVRQLDLRHARLVEVDPAHPPKLVRVQAKDGRVYEHYLDWDQTLDDRQHLRKCPVCGCRELFRMRGVRPLSAGVVLLVCAAASMLLYGLGGAPLGLVLGALGTLVVTNVFLYFFGPRRLGCYRCGSECLGVPISPQQEEWDPGVAEAYGREAPAPRESVPSGRRGRRPSEGEPRPDVVASISDRTSVPERMKVGN